ncbi:MAG: competence/damage-inducible protein A [Gemmatimonadetes bacterium]|nr:competence/damage-inducible protein A [Gemmatimonadota bacterium]
MNIELVTIGTELLLGFTIDTNAAHISRALASVGVRVVRRTTVGDGEAEIRSSVSDALERTGFVITTGGLGPTRDDITKKVLAEIFGLPLDLDEQYLEALRRRFEGMGRGPMPPSNRCQAEMPRGATVLNNQWGTAPGLWLEGKPGIAILLPGVPHEMKMLLEYEVIPRIEGRGKREEGRAKLIRSLTLRTTGIGESALAEKVGEVEERIAPVTLAYLPSVEGVDLRLTAWGADAEGAAQVLERAAGELRPAIAPYWYGDDESDLAAVLLDELRREGRKLAVAESCTGGMLGERITAVPGSSAVFVGGVIAYSDDAKAAELGVAEPLIREHGSVSEPVVQAMVEGVTRKFGVAAGIAITGIAGPDGGTAEKPVGTVWLAAVDGDQIRTVGRRFFGGRQEVRARSVQAGLDLLRRLGAS